MSVLTKWSGDQLKSLSQQTIQQVTVRSISYLSSKLKRVCFEGVLDPRLFTLNTVVRFQVDHNEFRDYTVLKYEADKGCCEIIFYLHGKGPGSKWAASLNVGDQANLIGQERKMKFDPTCRYHFFFGDETSIGFIASLKDHIHDANQNYLCLLEMEKEHCHWPDLTGISADIAHKSPGAVEVIDQLTGIHRLPWANGIFYLTGNAASIQVARKTLLQQHIKSSQILIENYWAAEKSF